MLDITFVGRTSRGHTGFFIHLLFAVRALIFLARRIQPFLSLVDGEVEFCILTTLNTLFARLGTDYEIRNQLFFAILEATTTD